MSQLTETADSWTAAWAEALDQLELDVAEAEQLLVGASAGLAGAGETQERRWIAPTDLGPLPDSLMERAVQVNARQLETARRIALALGANRREAELNHRLSPFSQRPAPVYVDHLM